jgi:hypothetical protein
MWGGIWCGVCGEDGLEGRLVRSKTLGCAHGVVVGAMALTSARARSNHLEAGRRFQNVWSGFGRLRWSGPDRPRRW